jgi:hypothetical protein
LTPQDAEVVGTLRGLVGTTGMSVQALMAALVAAVGTVRAAGSVGEQGPAGGSPAHAAAAAGPGPTVGGSPTSVVSVGGSLTQVRRAGGGGQSPAAADGSPTLLEVVALELAGGAASPEQRSAALPMLAALSPGPTQLFSPSAGAGIAQGLPVPGDVTDPDEERPAAARVRSRSPRQTEL